MKMHMAMDVILQLDIAQENRQLTQEEYNMRAHLKRRVMGLAVVERSRKRQASRITNIKEGDANTNFFHLKINARKRKNHIQRLQKTNGWAVQHEEKEQIIHEHFSSVMCQPPPRNIDINWNNLGIQSADLAALDEPFTEDEVHHTINQMPNDKAPGPDGFTGNFFKAC